MRVSDVAKQLHVSTSTVRYYTNSGQLHCQRTPSGHRFYTQEDIDNFLGKDKTEHIAFYIRSSKGDQKLMNSQLNELTEAYGTPEQIYKDKASGLNENRKGLQQAITAAENGTINVICATYNDRLTRFGTTYIKHIFEKANCEVRILHDDIKYSATDELMNDFMALIASFSGRFYRLRTKNNQKKLLNDAEKLVEKEHEEQ